MYWCVLMCCVLWCVGVTTGQQCDAKQTNALKFSITSRRNQTGHWVAQVQLEHGTGHEEAGPWVLDVNHKTAKCDDSEAVLIVATATAPPSEPRGPAALGYELVFGFGYYKLHTEVKTWQEAMETCLQEGTHLLIVNSDREAKALKPIWDKNPKIPWAAHNDWAWAGFHDLYKEGDYVTVFNESLASTGYMKWHAQEPTGANSNCGLLGRNLLLADYPCYNKCSFFCEKEL